MKKSWFLLVLPLILVPGCSKDYKWDNPLDPANNMPPSTMTADYPPDGKTRVDTAFTMLWTAANDPNSNDAVYYTLYLDDEQNPPQNIYADHIADNQYEVHLPWGRENYWRVVAHDEHGLHSTSPVYHFKTDSISGLGYYSYGTGWSPKRIHLNRTGNTAYVGDVNRYYTLNITDPANPTSLGAKYFGSNIFDIDRLYGTTYGEVNVIAFSTGIVLDIGYDPPLSINIPSGVYGLACVGYNIYAASGSSGLMIYGDQNYFYPDSLASCNTPGFARNLAIGFYKAYVADGGSGLRIIDISNISTPVETGSCDTPGYACDVAVAGNYAYVADSSAGLRIINISDPAHPVETGHCDIQGEAMGITLAGNYALVSAGSGGLKIINIGDPSNPKEASSFTPGPNVAAVAVFGNYAYVLAGGLYVIDITWASSK